MVSIGAKEQGIKYKEYETFKTANIPLSDSLFFVCYYTTSFQAKLFFLSLVEFPEVSEKWQIGSRKYERDS